MAISFVGKLDVLLNYAGFSYWIQRLMTIIALMYIRYRHIPVSGEILSRTISASP